MAIRGSYCVSDAYPAWSPLRLPARDTAEAMSIRNHNLHWREVTDAGHYIHDDQPEIVTRWVISFLAESNMQAIEVT
jgi:pimeloyl-ACP methyl ester carboxylesterase